MRLAALSVLLAGCFPVLPAVNPGFVSTDTRAPGAVDLGVQAGATGICADDCGAFPGASFHVDPYATARLSVPIEATLGFGTSANDIYVPTRVGVRYRLTDGFSLGAGGGVGIIALEDADLNLGGQFDIELAASRTFPQGAISVATRPGYSMAVYNDEVVDAFMLPVEFGSVYFLNPEVGLGGTVMGGLSYTQETVFLGFGASLTLVFRAGATTAAAEVPEPPPPPPE